MKAKNAEFDIGAQMISIPPRSQDNPIENFFHLMKKHLTRDALEQNITQESYQQFSDRVKETILNFLVATIDKNIIESMDKQMNMIIKKNRQRLRY